MKLKDIQTIENGIMNIFKLHYVTEFNTIFENQNANDLDLYILDFFGQRNLKSTVSLLNFERLLIGFIGVNIQRWLEYMEIINNPNNALISKEIKTKEGTLETENNAERLTAAKVFNDTNFVDDNKETDANDTINTYNLIETTEKNENQLKKSIEILQFKKRYTNFAIIKEIIDFLTLKIY